MVDSSYSDSIHIQAEPEFVFDYFTNADALARWIGDRAIVEPRVGGRFTVFFGERIVEGRYVEIEPPRRLVISWGRDGSRELPPCSSRLEVTLTPERDGTLVLITHSDLPESERERHALGWQHYLTRLSKVVVGGDVVRHETPAELTEGAD